MRRPEFRAMRDRAVILRLGPIYLYPKTEENEMVRRKEVDDAEEALRVATNGLTRRWTYGDSYYVNVSLSGARMVAYPCHEVTSAMAHHPLRTPLLEWLLRCSRVVDMWNANELHSIPEESP